MTKGHDRRNRRWSKDEETVQVLESIISDVIVKEMFVKGEIRRNCQVVEPKIPKAIDDSNRNRVENKQQISSGVGYYRVIVCKKRLLNCRSNVGCVRFLCKRY